jgi:hypothetical protein
MAHGKKRALRRIFGPKRDGAVGGWRNLHVEELRNSYSFANTIRIFKSRMVRWTGYVARVAERSACSVLYGKPEVRNH